MSFAKFYFFRCAPLVLKKPRLFLRGCVGDSDSRRFAKGGMEWLKWNWCLRSLRECFVMTIESQPFASPRLDSTRRWRVGWIFFIALHRKPRGSRVANGSCSHVVSFWKEQQDQEGARVGKSISYLFARGSWRIFPTPAVSHLRALFTVDLNSFSSFRHRSAADCENAAVAGVRWRW